LTRNSHRFISVRASLMVHQETESKKGDLVATLK